MPTAAAAKPSNTQLLNEEDQLTAEEQAAVTAEEAPPQVLPAPHLAPPPPEQAAPPEAHPPKKKLPEDSVTYDRFKEVNEENKRKDRELSELREKWARLEERSNLAREAQARYEQEQQAAATRAKTPEKPDPAIDPYGAQLWERDRQIEALGKRLEEVTTGLGQTNQQLQQSSQLNDFNLWLTNDITNYRARQPDYEQAASHARTARMGFWQSVGLPPEQAEAIVNNEALAIAYAAKQNGKSAAQAYYDAAKVMGYQAGAAPAPNGAAPASAPAAPPTPQEKMAQLRKGQAAQGLSRAPVLDENNANWSALTAQQIADMDENDFVEALQDPQRAQQINKALERLEGLRQ